MYILILFLYNYFFCIIYELDFTDHNRFLDYELDYELIEVPIFELLINKNIVEDIGIDLRKDLYHKIIFETSYYNGYSLIRALSILLAGLRDLSTSEDDKVFLDEPIIEITLYEFFTNIHTSEDADKFIFRLLKIIERIHYFIEGSDEIKLNYLNRRFNKTITSTNNLLKTFI